MCFGFSVCHTIQGSISQILAVMPYWNWDFVTVGWWLGNEDLARERPLSKWEWLSCIFLDRHYFHRAFFHVCLTHWPPGTKSSRCQIMLVTLWTEGHMLHVMAIGHRARTSNGRMHNVRQRTACMPASNVCIHACQVTLNPWCWSIGTDLLLSVDLRLCNECNCLFFSKGSCSGRK